MSDRNAVIENLKEHIHLAEWVDDIYAENVKVELLKDALELIEHEKLIEWHRYPDEKPEDYVDSTILEGKTRWTVTCITVSVNGRTFFQKRARYLNHSPDRCWWTNGDPKWWAFVPKPPKGEDDD